LHDYEFGLNAADLVSKGRTPVNGSAWWLPRGFGLATTGGTVSSAGGSRFSRGGGLLWLMGRLGLV
jgi:hypothetical protein